MTAAATAAGRQWGSSKKPYDSHRRTAPEVVMRLHRRALLQTALAAPALLRMGAARAAGPKVIRAVPIGDLKVLDPIWTTAYITRNHGYLVWDTLFARDARNRPQPQMVERWQVSDN